MTGRWWRASRWMYQRSSSSAKGGAPRKTAEGISRQPLQSSSSSAAVAAAAVAAAGAEASWRGLDRVRELSWQTTDRGPQRRTATSEGMKEALSSRENSRPGGTGQSEARRPVLDTFSVALTLRLCSWPKYGLFVHLCVLRENTPILARSVFVLHCHRLCRDILVLLIVFVLIMKISFLHDTVN